MCANERGTPLGPFKGKQDGITSFSVRDFITKIVKDSELVRKPLPLKLFYLPLSNLVARHLQAAEEVSWAYDFRFSPEVFWYPIVFILLSFWRIWVPKNLW